MKFMTVDAFTLTNGPTIYISSDVNKVAEYCYQQMFSQKLGPSGDDEVIKDISMRIDYNKTITEKIQPLEVERDNMQNELESRLEHVGGSEIIRKLSRDEKEENSFSKSKATIQTLNSKIDSLLGQLAKINLPNQYIPNSYEHLQLYGPKFPLKEKPFCCSILDEHAVKIMGLDQVDSKWKLLLLMGIGVFSKHPDERYTEIMKELADKQLLFMIIASPDYIFGTNYQMSHGYIGNDIVATTEKLKQALGRIGRGNVQQRYTVRIRKTDIVKKLFSRADTLEAEIMVKVLA